MSVEHIIYGLVSKTEPTHACTFLRAMAIAPAVFKHDRDDILNGRLLAGFEIAGLCGGGFLGGGGSALLFGQQAGGGQRGKLVPGFGGWTHASGLLRHARHIALLKAVAAGFGAIAPRTHFPCSNTGRHGAFFVIDQFQRVLFVLAFFVCAQHLARAEVVTNSTGHTALGPSRPFADLAAICPTPPARACNPIMKTV